MTQTNRAGRRAAAPGDHDAPGARGRRPAHRVRHGDRRRDVAGPSPCPRLGQRDRASTTDRSDDGPSARTGDAVRPSRARPAAAPPAHPRVQRPARRFDRARQPRHAAASTSWRPARRPTSCRRANRCRRRRSCVSDTTATRPTNRRPASAARAATPGVAAIPQNGAIRSAAEGRAAAKSAASAGRRKAAMTGTIARPSVDLAAWRTTPFRCRSSTGSGRRGASCPSATRTPMPTRSAPVSRSSIIGEQFGAHVTPVCADPPPPLYDFLPGADRVRSDPEAGVEYDLLVVSDCGTLERTGAVLERHGDLLRAPAARHDRPPRLERRRRATPTGSTRPPPRPARWSRCSRTRLGVPLDDRTTARSRRISWPAS